MPELVQVIPLSSLTTEVVSRALDLLNTAQGDFIFRASKPSSDLPPPDLDNAYSWSLLERELVKQRTFLKAEYLFGILASPIEDNCFSRSIYEEKVCFITTCDWEYLSHLPLVSYLAYEIAENLIEMLVDGFVPHIDTRGCISDLCVSKADISFKIRTADICPECAELFQRHLGEKHLQAFVGMLEAIRLAALGRGGTDKFSGPALTLPERIDREFPFPIAYCFRSMQAEINYSRRWSKAIEFNEVSIKYLTFALLAARGAAGVDPPVNLRESIARLQLAPMGHWVAACFGLIDWLRREGANSFLSRYLHGLTTVSIRRGRQSVDRLVALRNDTHHGFVASEGQHRNLYERSIGDIQTLAEFIAPLADYPLLKVENLRRRLGASRFQAKVLRGSHPIFPIEDFETREDVETDCVLYDRETGRFANLHPWLVLDTCQTCHREVVFLYDKMAEGAVVMREYPTNHTQRREDLQSDLSARCPFLLG